MESPSTLPDPKAPMIEMRNVSKWYDKFQVLKDISLTAGIGAEFIECQEQALAGLVDELAPLGQLESGTPALAQSQAEPLLERGHVGADGGLADIQIDLRRRKPAGLDDFGEDLEQPDVALGKIGQQARPPFGR